MNAQMTERGESMWSLERSDTVKVASWAKTREGHNEGARAPRARCIPRGQRTRRTQRKERAQRVERRFNLPRETPVQVGLRIGDSDACHRIADVSSGGMSFFLDAGNLRLMPGSRITAHLEVGRSMRFRMKLEVRHHAGPKVGCRVSHGPELWFQEVGRLMIAVRIGRCFRRIAPGGESADGNEWYQSGSDNNLIYSVDDNGRLDWVELSFRDRVVEWTATRGMCTGTLDSYENRMGYKASDVWSYDATIDWDCLLWAGWIIRSGDLPAALKELFTFDETSDS